jgi:hypothetical protein
MAAPTNANPTLNLILPGYDSSGHQVNVAIRILNAATDATTGVIYGDLSVGGTVTANNASVGTLESPIPGSATLIGVNDSAGNLDELMLESDANPNLRIAVFNGANELAVDSNGVTKAILQVVSGTNLTADQANTILRSSLYVKTTTAGDTVLTLGQATKANSVPVTLASDQSPFTTATGTITSVAGSVSSVTILNSNTSRKNAIFYNDSTAILYLNLAGSVASTSIYSVQIQANGYFELPPAPIYTGSITGIWSAANGNVRITEFS